MRFLDRKDYINGDRWLNISDATHGVQKGGLLFYTIMKGIVVFSSFFSYLSKKHNNLQHFQPALGVGFTPASPLKGASNNLKITVMLPQQNWKFNFSLRVYLLVHACV